MSVQSSDGMSVADYYYDAWGNQLVCSGTLAELNPLRYRGYVYDQETGFYYLQSRYYDPVIGRFINADSYASTGAGVIGCNMFAYCNNNPVIYIDVMGDIPQWLGNTLSGIGVAVGTVMFAGAIVASAGAVAALAGIAAATVGATTATVAVVATVTTYATYAIAGSAAVLGANDAVEAFTGGTNLIRDKLLKGNQSTYDAVKGTVNALGTVAVIAGMVGPKVAQGIAKATGRAMTSKGQTVGYQKNFADSKGNWNLRIDATTHGNAKYHHNPHYHVGDRGGKGTSIRTIWETIKGWFGPNK